MQGIIGNPLLELDYIFVGVQLRFRLKDCIFWDTLFSSEFKSVEDS